jgi:hypothetical protein
MLAQKHNPRGKPFTDALQTCSYEHATILPKFFPIMCSLIFAASRNVGSPNALRINMLYMSAFHEVSCLSSRRVNSFVSFCRRIFLSSAISFFSSSMLIANSLQSLHRFFTEQNVIPVFQ